MKPVFKVRKKTTPNRSYEYVELDGSQLCELEDSKVVLTTVKSGLTSQTKVGMFEDVFVIQRAQEQFGFLMNAFQYGAPPHGGIAFGLDRLVSIFAGLDSIRDCIAFPKNNSGRDMMLDAPSKVDQAQLDELGIMIKEKK